MPTKILLEFRFEKFIFNYEVTTCCFCWINVVNDVLSMLLMLLMFPMTLILILLALVFLLQQPHLDTKCSEDRLDALFATSAWSIQCSSVFKPSSHHHKKILSKIICLVKENLDLFMSNNGFVDEEGVGLSQMLMVVIYNIINAVLKCSRKECRGFN